MRRWLLAGLLAIGVPGCGDDDGGGARPAAGFQESPVSRLFAAQDRDHFLAPPGEIRALAWGDVDRDGDLDLVVGYGARHTKAYAWLRLLRNDGGGVFADATGDLLPPFACAAAALALGDVDGDGDLDLVVADERESLPSLLFLNDGAGRFALDTQGRIPEYSGSTIALALGDLDGDGDPDLVRGIRSRLALYTFGPAQNRLFLNDGGGFFAHATTGRLPLVETSTRALALGDLDGDGDLDLVEANDGQNRIYRNDGRGIFADKTPGGPGQPGSLPWDPRECHALALGDVDGDGDLDLVFGDGQVDARTGAYLGGGLRLLVNDGLGAFADRTAAQLPPLAAPVTALALGDADGDGDRDLLVGTALLGSWTDIGLRLFVNEGTGRFVEAADRLRPNVLENLAALAPADADGDGDLDLAAGSDWLRFPGRCRLFLNAGPGIFADASAPTTGSALRLQHVSTMPAPAVADLDGDGLPDLLRPERERVRLLMNDGHGGLVERTPPGLASIPGVVAVRTGDVDGDGDVDLVVGRYRDPAVRIFHDRLFLNDGTGNLQETGRFPEIADPTHDWLLADLDGDGDLDLSLSVPGTDIFVANDGRGGFTASPKGTVFPPDLDDPASRYVPGDVDGDGDLDLLVNEVSLGSGNAIRLLLNDGAGSLAYAAAGRFPAPVPGASLNAEELLDAGGDGALDLLVSLYDFQEGKTAYYLCRNDGRGFFAGAPPEPLPGTAFNKPVAADLDGDGDVDLGLFPDLLVNDGAGRFTVWRSDAVGVGAWAPAAADLDGDGDLDLLQPDVAPDASSFTFPIYRNLTRQAFAPRLPAAGAPWRLVFHARPGGVPGVYGVLPLLGSREGRRFFPAHGWLRIDPAGGLLGLPVLATGPATGSAEGSYPIPADPVLAGQLLVVQAVVEGREGGAWVWRFSNVVAEAVR